MIYSTSNTILVKKCFLSHLNTNYFSVHLGQIEVSLANGTDVTLSEETGMVRVCLQVNTFPLSTVDIGYNINIGTADTSGTYVC